MKTLQLKTLPLLLVELPEGAHGIKMFNDIGRPYISYFVGVETFRHYTDEDVELIGKLSELPEELFEQYVEGTEFHQVHEPYSPTIERESFYSLLEAKERVHLNGNPCGDEAQSCTFDPERTYIFTVKTKSNELLG